MDNDDTRRLPWESPGAVAITDTDSRADQADVTMPNGSLSNPN